MSVKIYYSNKTPNKSSSNLVLFVDDKFNITNLKKHLSSTELSYINDLLKNNDLKKICFFLKLIQKKK